MTISPIFAYPAYSAPVTYGAPVQSNQPVMNISPNAKGEPDLVCGAQYNAQNKTLQLNSFERGWIDSNMWRTINSDGSGAIQSAWGYVSKYPAGTFLDVFNKGQEIYYNNGKISDDAALELEKSARAATDIARQNGLETTEKMRF